MSETLDRLESVTFERIVAAEQAAKTVFFQFVREDLGDDLAEHLDTDRFYGVRSMMLDQDEPWRLDIEECAVVLRFPDCSEIVVKYRKLHSNSWDGKDEVGYRNQRWEAYPWTGGGSGTSDFSFGKFGAIRFEIDDSRREETKLVPASVHSWVCTDKIEAAKVAARKYQAEKAELERRTNEIIEEAINAIGTDSLV